MVKRVGLLVLLLIASLHFSKCKSNDDCDFDLHQFLNGPNANVSSSSVWHCSSTNSGDFRFQAFEDRTGISSKIGPFTWHEVGCRSMRVEGSTPQTLDNIQGSIASGIISFTIFFDDGNSDTIGCTLENCPPGMSYCDDVCSDIDTDPYNCGGCGNICNSDENCEGRVCTPKEFLCTDGIDNDDDGLTDCEDIDCDDDPCCVAEDCDNGRDDNCDGLIDCNDADCNCCSYEMTYCGPGRRRDGVCSDLNTDSENCGACNNDCSSSRQQCCSGECIDDILSNTSHCGHCGNACRDGEACCRAICTNLMTDSSNCGRCLNDCGAGGRCVDGHC